eukprot:3165071-Pyramimonas_sp.AAC.1
MNPDHHSSPLSAMQQHNQPRQDSAQECSQSHIEFFRHNPPRGVNSQLDDKGPEKITRIASGAEAIGAFISNLSSLSTLLNGLNGPDEGDLSKKRSLSQLQNPSQYNQLMTQYSNGPKRTKVDGSDMRFAFSTPSQDSGGIKKTSSNVAEMLTVTKSLLQRLEGEGALMGFTASEMSIPGVPGAEPSVSKGADAVPGAAGALEEDLVDDADGDEPSKKEKAVKVKKTFLRILRKVMEIPNESPLG